MKKKYDIGQLRGAWGAGRRSAEEENSFYLKDKPIHILKDGKTHNQGVIVGKDEDNYVIQRFSFLDGAPTDIIIISEKELFDPKRCRIYGNKSEWHRAFYSELEQDGLLVGNVEEKVNMTLRLEEIL